MAETDRKKNNWQLPFLISLSLLLIVTFIFYLPLRFRNEAMDEQHKEMAEEQQDEHAARDNHG